MASHRKRSRLLMGLVAFMLIAAALVVGFAFITQGRNLIGGGHARSVEVLDSFAPTSAAASNAPAPPAPAPKVPLPTTSTVPVPSGPRSSAPVGPSLDAYRGLGSWVDIYDDRAWANPVTAVRDMAHHGVRTLYLETGNSSQPTTIFKPASQRLFIQQAHARHMKVVAWYLPEMKSLSKDYARVSAAIKLKTSDGQKFDSFALDIESGAVTPQSVRNARLTTLSTKIRTLVGPSYPLGAIIPSPVGLSRKGSYWGSLPYTMLAGKYDVFVPMSYYSYHAHGASAVYADTLANYRILRGKKGCAGKPVHLIGGIAENSTPSEVQAFVRAERDAQCLGASLYGWPGTSAGMWRYLQGVAK